MTDTSSSQSLTATPPASALRRVRSGAVPGARRLLRLDAALCALAGAGVTAGAPLLARLVEGEPVGAVRVIGFVLLVVAADLFLMSHVRRERMADAVTAAGAINLAWVAATVAVVAAGWLHPAGTVLALASAALVAAFAWTELAAGARLRRAQSSRGG